MYIVSALIVNVIEFPSTDSKSNPSNANLSFVTVAVAIATSLLYNLTFSKASFKSRSHVLETVNPFNVESTLGVKDTVAICS
jgi:hypothetical protein